METAKKELEGMKIGFAGIKWDRVVIRTGKNSWAVGGDKYGEVNLKGERLTLEDAALRLARI